MPHNFDKTWLQSSLNRHAIQRAQVEIEATGRALPCVVTAVSGSIVTVSFEVGSNPFTIPNVTIPKAEGPWIRSPTQVGDTGLTLPSAAYLGGISGLGGGTANLTARANLTPLVWIPVASTAFGAVNTNAAYVSGPEGAVIQTEDGSTVITADASGVTITAGGKTWTFNSAGFTMATGIVAETHIHSQAADSAGDSEQDTGVPIS